METYRVQIQESSYGYVDIEAKNEDEAREKADQIITDDDGQIEWVDNEFDILEVEELK